MRLTNVRRNLIPSCKKRSHFSNVFKFVILFCVPRDVHLAQYLSIPHLISSAPTAYIELSHVVDPERSSHFNRYMIEDKGKSYLISQVFVYMFVKEACRILILCDCKVF